MAAVVVAARGGDALELLEERDEPDAGVHLVLRRGRARPLGLEVRQPLGEQLIEWGRRAYPDAFFGEFSAGEEVLVDAVGDRLSLSRIGRARGETVPPPIEPEVEDVVPGAAVLLEAVRLCASIHDSRSCFR
ncbi:MAG: hypothetical protein AB8I08_22535 [Sandaracinaceae bacterium]